MDDITRFDRDMLIQACASIRWHDRSQGSHSFSFAPAFADSGVCTKGVRTITKKTTSVIKISSDEQCPSICKNMLFPCCVHVGNSRCSGNLYSRCFYTDTKPVRNDNLEQDIYYGNNDKRTKTDNAVLAIAKCMGVILQPQLTSGIDWSTRRATRFLSPPLFSNPTSQFSNFSGRAFVCLPRTFSF